MDKRGKLWKNYYKGWIMGTSGDHLDHRIPRNIELLIQLLNPFLFQTRMPAKLPLARDSRLSIRLSHEADSLISLVSAKACYYLFH